MSSVADETTSGSKAPRDADDDGTAGRPRRRPRVSAKQVAHGAKVGSDAVRARVASIVWIVAVVCAVIVVLGAILVALGSGVRTGNPVVQFINDTADALAGPFGKMFSYQKDNGKPDVVQNTVLGYGIAAVVYLVVGKIVSRVIHP
jgi:hypothetical protein